MTGQSTAATNPPYGPMKEVLDYVEREGPLTVDEAVEGFGIYAPDSVYTWLRELEEEGYLDSEAENFEEYGTTRRVWFVDEVNSQGESQ